MHDILKPVRLDELTISEHRELSADDLCIYLGSYDAHNDDYTNPIKSIIHNLKKTKDQPHYGYKERDIKRLGQYLSTLFDANRIVVPVPPAKIKSDPNYNAKLSEILFVAKEFNKNINFIEMIIQKENRDQKHKNNTRPCFIEQSEWYCLDEDLINKFQESLKSTNKVIIFDDVLTTGATYKAIELKIKEKFPQVDICGLFIARIRHDAASLVDFDLLD